MHSLLTALEFIHCVANIVHKDIKYNNFLFNRYLLTGKLIDFGLAVFQNELKEGANIGHIQVGGLCYSTRALYLLRQHISSPRQYQTCL